MLTLDWPDVPYLGPAANYTSGHPDGPVLGVIVHCTANTATPTGEATYAKRANPASSTVYAGDADPPLVQSLAMAHSPWHAGGRFGNRRFLAIEFCGLVSWSRARWLANDARAIRAGALFIARAAARYGFPVRWLTSSTYGSLYRSPTPARGGLLTHLEYNQWSPDAGSDHNDPGPGFPRDVLLKLAAGTVPTPPRGEICMCTLGLKTGDTGDRVCLLQASLNLLLPDDGQLVVDGEYGGRTAAAVLAVLGGRDGAVMNYELVKRLDQHIAQRYAGQKGDPGDPGPRGEPGPPGAAAVITAGTRLIVEG
jgi:hypothetical protein